MSEKKTKRLGINSKDLKQQCPVMRLFNFLSGLLYIIGLFCAKVKEVGKIQQTYRARGMSKMWWDKITEYGHPMKA